MAANFAIGKPVALEASADERDRRGFISMITMAPVAGSSANWMLEPPVSTPTLRMQAMAASRMIWYSRSVSVWAGATVIESPVWTPIGSTFSIEQMMTTLSFLSRITSSSNSFHPISDCSISTSCVRESCSPSWTMRSNSSGVRATPPPVPPRVKLGRTTLGKPVLATAARAACRLPAIVERGTARPISSMAQRKSCRRSATWIAARSAPIISTPNRSNRPASAASTARLRAVWPPSVVSTASGRSRSRMRSSAHRLIGST